MTTTTTLRKPVITNTMTRALAAVSEGRKVRSDMLERLEARGLVKLVKEQRASGAGGMPSIWYVTTGATLTDAGTRHLEAAAEPDAECIHCGAPHCSFGLLPLCERCTRAHARCLGPEVAPPFVAGAGIDALRRAVRLFNNCNETFNQSFTAPDLIKLHAAYARSTWDIAPDRWTAEEIADALHRDGNGATGDR